MKIHYIFCAHFLCLLLQIPGFGTISANSHYLLPPALWPPAISASGSTSICEGGTVLLTASGSSGTDVDNSNFLFGLGGTDQWQSFYPGTSGSLDAISIRTNGCTTNNTVTVTIYEGAGTSGTVISTQNIIVNGCNLTVFIPFTGVDLDAGFEYTFRLQSSTNLATLANQNQIGSYYSNDYGGNTSYNLAFLTSMSASIGDLQWFKDDVLIEGAIETTYLASTIGNYTAKSGSEGNYSVPSNIINVNNTPPVAPQITAGGPLTFCAPGSVTLTASVSPATDLNFGPQNLGTLGTNQWQSFIPLKDGLTTAIKINSNSNSQQTFNIYEGEGIFGTLIHSQVINVTNGLFSITIPGGIHLNPGAVFTFQLTGATLFLGAINNSSYGSYFSDAYGLNPSWRLSFQTIVTPFFSPQWYAGGVLIEGATSDTYEAVFSGLYSVVNSISGCLSATSNVITVNANPPNTISLTSPDASDAQKLCQNTSISNITYDTNGATGATFAGFPSGVIAVWNNNSISISGIPTESGSFNYQITLTGGCGNISVTGNITVVPSPRANATPPTQDLCNNNTTNIVLSSNVPGSNITWIVQSITGSISGQSDGSGSLIAQILNNSGSSMASVTYAVTASATDSITCASSPTLVSILVSPSPFIDCPNNLMPSESADTSMTCSRVASWTNPSISEAVCQPSGLLMSIDGGEPVVVTPGSDYSQVFGVGEFTVSYYANDGSLIPNSDTCSFTIIVVDDKLPVAVCNDLSVTFNGQTSVQLDSDDLVNASDNCAIQSISLTPTQVFPQEIGQSIPFTATVTDVNGNSSTCTANVNVTGLPVGWSQSSNGVNCNDGSNINYNPANQIWTATSSNCFYSSPYTSDAMSFAQHTLCGDGSITAQVTGINGTTLGWAGVIMRENSEAGAKKVQLTTNRNSNLNRREVRSLTNGQAFPQQFPAQNRYWLRIVRTGNQFVGYSSSNGINWFSVMVVSVPMSSCIELGLVLSNYSQNSIVTATFANVSLIGNFLGLPASNDNFAVSQESVKLPDFEVYPNPSNGEIYIDMSSYAGKSVRIELYNMQGQLLKFIERDEIVSNQKEQMNLSGYAPGMYFVKLKSLGLKDATKRVVLQGNQNRP